MPLYCVRHGQSVANAGGLTMEHSAIPLSPLGIAQAAALATVLDVKPSLVLVSSYLRAIETAEPFCARHDCLPEIHPLLHEFSALDASQLQGMDGAGRRPLADAYWQACDPALRSGPGAETFFEFDARVEAFATTLPSVPDRAVLFGHGMVRAAVLEAQRRRQGRHFSQDGDVSALPARLAHAELRSLCARTAAKRSMERKGRRSGPPGDGTHPAGRGIDDASRIQ